MLTDRGGTLVGRFAAATRPRRLARTSTSSRCAPKDGIDFTALAPPVADAPLDPRTEHAEDASLAPRTGESNDKAPSSVAQHSVIALLTFSLPTLCIAITNPSLSLMDTAVVGLNSELQLAAMSPATMLSDSSCYTLTFIPIAVTNLVALRMARGQAQAAGRVVGQALAMALAVSVALAAALLCCAPQIIAAIAAIPADMLAHAAAYVRIRALGLPAFLCYAVLQAFFLACKEPWIPMKATFAAGLINAVGDVVLCCVLNMGCAGAALATSAANWIVLVLMLRAAREPLPPGASPYAGQTVGVGLAPCTLASVATFLQTSGPVFGVILTKVVIFACIAARAAEMGQTTAASHQILFTLALWFGALGDTVCQAAQAFLPPLIGEPARARALGRSLMWCGAAVACVNGVAGGAITLLGAQAFTESAQVVGAVAGAAPLFVAFVVLHCCSMGTEGILLAGRDNEFLLLSYALHLAVVLVALDAVVSRELGLTGIWLVCVLFQGMRLAVNSAWLLLPRSVLSRTQPLPDKLAALESAQAGRECLESAPEFAG